MSVVNIWAAHADSILVLDRLRSNRLSAVRDALYRMSPDHLEEVIGMVLVEMYDHRESPGLDPQIKKILSDQQQELSELWAEIRASWVESERVGELEGYPKYQETCVLLGKDPLIYEDWMEVQKSFEYEAR